MSVRTKKLNTSGKNKNFISGNLVNSARVLTHVFYGVTSHDFITKNTEVFSRVQFPEFKALKSVGVLNVYQISEISFPGQGMSTDFPRSEFRFLVGTAGRSFHPVCTFGHF